MTLIKDLIAIPERVQRGDFVLRLSEGVTRAEDAQALFDCGVAGVTGPWARG